jgi:broad specificity phosphatase PhoE
MPSLYIVRHGESQSQVDPSVCGINPDLSQKGVSQSIALKNVFDKLTPDLVLLSPLKRAYHTFLLSELNCKNVKFDGRLLEGEWEGAPSYSEDIYEGLSAVATIENLKWHEQSVDSRVSSLVEHLHHLHLDSVALFSHSGTINLMLKLLLNVSQHDKTWFQIENSSITKIELKDGSSFMTSFNDSTHLN